MEQGDGIFIILLSGVRWFLREVRGMVGIGSIWLRIGTGGGLM
jgi:hypothetical protein